MAIKNLMLFIIGLLPLREAICQFHQIEDKLEHFDAADVIVGPGSKELIYLVQAVTTGGSLFYIQST